MERICFQGSESAAQGNAAEQSMQSPGSSSTHVLPWQKPLCKANSLPAPQPVQLCDAYRQHCTETLSSWFKTSSQNTERNHSETCSEPDLGHTAEQSLICMRQVVCAGLIHAPMEQLGTTHC